jgi:hypothetical protein
MFLYLGAARSVVRRSKISDAIQENLKARYEGYNPRELHREITRLQKKLLKMVTSVQNSF